MKKRLLLSLCLALSLVLSCAVAEEVIEPPVPETVGFTPDGGLIRRFETAEGEQLYYLSYSEDAGVIVDDVNFDGQDDLVALTRMGASNAGYEFFIRTEDGYALAMRSTTEEALYNYELDEEKQLVISSLNIGWAGALTTETAYRWEGNQMKCLRAAVSEQSSADPSYLHMTVTDMTGDFPVVLWETDVPVDAEDALSVALSSMRLALLSGL